VEKAEDYYKSITRNSAYGIRPTSLLLDFSGDVFEGVGYTCSFRPSITLSEFSLTFRAGCGF
jgi:hypothetical protein